MDCHNAVVSSIADSANPPSIGSTYFCVSSCPPILERLGGFSVDVEFVHLG